MSIWDIFRMTNSPEPYNNFGRLPEDEVRELVEKALAKIDWSKAGLDRYGHYTYGDEIYNRAKEYAEAQAQRDAKRIALEEITADKVMKEQYDTMKATQAKADKALHDLNEMASLVQAALTDTGFPEVAKELAGRFTNTHANTALELAYTKSMLEIYQRLR